MIGKIVLDVPRGVELLLPMPNIRKSEEQTLRAIRGEERLSVPMPWPKDYSHVAFPSSSSPIAIHRTRPVYVAQPPNRSKYPQ